MTLPETIKALGEARGKRDEIARRVSEEKTTIRELMDREIVVERTQACVEVVAQRIQERLRYRVRETVSYALAYVFDDPFDFDIEFSIKHGHVEAKLLFLQDGHKVSPMLASGGGDIDVGAFAMRIAMWGIRMSMFPGSLAPLLILDEPFKNINGEAENRRAWGMLRQLSKRMKYWEDGELKEGIQVMVITQEGTRGAADRIFRMVLTKDVTGDRVTNVTVEDREHSEENLA